MIPKVEVRVLLTNHKSLTLLLTQKKQFLGVSNKRLDTRRKQMLRY